MKTNFITSCFKPANSTEDLNSLDTSDPGAYLLTHQIVKSSVNIIFLVGHDVRHVDYLCLTSCVSVRNVVGDAAGHVATAVYTNIA